MRYLLLLLPLFLLLACGSDDVTKPAGDPVVTEMWVVDGVAYDSEPAAFDAIDALGREPLAARDAFDPNGCQHWTFEQGTWWIRNCGLTLSDQCMYFSGPTGEIRSCDEVGGGPGGNW